MKCQPTLWSAGCQVQETLLVGFKTDAFYILKTEIQFTSLWNSLLCQGPIVSLIFSRSFYQINRVLLKNQWHDMDLRKAEAVKYLTIYIFHFQTLPKVTVFYE